MNPKGHSPVDLESAEPASSRRSLIGAVGAVGIAGAAALVASRPAAAAPFAISTEDRALLDQAMRMELTASDLYQVALDAGVADQTAEVAATFAANHGAYAQAIAGVTGSAADTRDEALFADLEGTFATSDNAEFGQAAADLENSAAATHTEFIEQFESIEAITLAGSIVVVEARHATVAANIGGLDSNLESLFHPDSEAFDLNPAEES